MARMEAEDTWRGIYGQAFVPPLNVLKKRPKRWPPRRSRRRFQQGSKADYEYQKEPCTHYLIVPFSAGVAGLPVHVLDQRLDAYECRGRLIPLGTFCDVEFFICPIDFAWAMIHTHEDHALGGPYFIRAEWLTEDSG
jgi:hypothetical protein